MGGTRIPSGDEGSGDVEGVTKMGPGGWRSMGRQRGEKEVSQGERGSRKRVREGKNKGKVGIQRGIGCR